ncbi:hypothetical protein DAI22_05g249100 [Oryza sativa Japonica Group]|uniref:Uncharacterized protein n=1 Tax=Oryza rufipogon TaxID=4529 RepID=A0A0E0PQS3_ORYRU|nr:hypothetical protein DAI22_05g249100 [Oryza sativa Japonica Group]
MSTEIGSICSRTIMCSSVPGLALLNTSISKSWSDEELVRFLAERKAADSLPENVVVGMNFSLIDPWNSDTVQADHVLRFWGFSSLLALKCAHKRSGSSSRRIGDVMRQE